MFLKIFEKFIHGLSFGVGMGISFIIIPKENKFIGSPPHKVPVEHLKDWPEPPQPHSAAPPETPLSMSPLLRCG